MITIAVDFDGTIVTHEYPRIGREIPFAVETLIKLQNEFEVRLILWTVREGDLLNEAVEYCRQKGLEFYAVNANFPEETTDDNQPRKLKVDLFIDDRSLGGLPDWGIIYQMIKSGKPLEPIPDNALPNTQPVKKGLFSIFKK